MSTTAELEATESGVSCRRGLWPDLDGRLSAGAEELARRYRRAEPYPHLVLDDFLPPEALGPAMDEFPGPGDGTWIRYKHLNNDTLGRSDRDAVPRRLGEVLDALNSARFVEILSRITGIEGLRADPDLEGGGLHQTERGGFLNVHADFTRHPRKPGWRRRCNLIVFLNEEWRDEWKGALELWDREMQEARVHVAPLCNRAILFATDRDSFHGYPEPISCPPDRTRRSLALYYYNVEEDDESRGRSTNYRPRPGDPLLRRTLIRLDARAVGIYSRLKRRFGLSDEAVGRLLARLGGRPPDRSGP